MKCGQEGCEEKAFCMMEWPGGDMMGICEPHLDKAVGVAEAMGLARVFKSAICVKFIEPTPTDVKGVERMGSEVRRRVKQFMRDAEELRKEYKFLRWAMNDVHPLGGGHNAEIHLSMSGNLDVITTDLMFAEPAQLRALADLKDKVNEWLAGKDWTEDG